MGDILDSNNIQKQNFEYVKNIIDKVEPKQGTFLGAALEQAYTMMNLVNIDNKEVMLISGRRVINN